MYLGRFYLSINSNILNYSIVYLDIVHAQYVTTVIHVLLEILLLKIQYNSCAEWTLASLFAHGSSKTWHLPGFNLNPVLHSIKQINYEGSSQIMIGSLAFQSNLVSFPRQRLLPRKLTGTFLLPFHWILTSLPNWHPLKKPNSLHCASNFR